MLYLFKEKQKTISALVFGALFSTVNLLGKYLENNFTMDIRQYLLIVLMAIPLMLIIGEIYLRAEAFIKKQMRQKEIEKSAFIKNDKQYFLLCVLVLCAAYIPVFLAYYPGLFAYDVDTQIPQYLYGYTKHHNLIHTLYLHFFYYFIGGKILNSYTAGIAWASVVQMLIFSMMISYIHLFFRRIDVNSKIRAVLIALSAVLPFFSVLSVSMTKDVLFTGFVGIFAVCLFYWEKNDSYYRRKSNQLIYILSLIGTVLFRNNGIYAVLFSACVGFITIVILKRNLKYFWCTMIGIILSVLISSGMASALSATNGSQNEMLSIPYQQLAYVYNTEFENLTEDEKDKIIELIPDVEKYNPHLSDPVKANAIGAYNKKELLTCYVKLFLKYPLEYVEAFMLNNLGYLYIGDTTHAEIYGADIQERSGYLLTDTKDNFGIEHTTYFEQLENLYERLYSANEYQNIFPLFIFCSPAVYFWLFILLLFYMIDFRRSCWTQFSFVFILILTVLAGPCALIRYAFPYIICVPILAAAFFLPEK